MKLNLRNLCATVVAVMTVCSAASVSAEANTKQVCKNVVGADGRTVKNNDGTVKQICKTIKTHKKLEGTPVPDKK